MGDYENTMRRNYGKKPKRFDKNKQKYAKGARFRQFTPHQAALW